MCFEFISKTGFNESGMDFEILLKGEHYSISFDDGNITTLLSETDVYPYTLIILLVIR